MKITEFLNELIATGWNQTTIAKKCGYTSSHISKLLKAEHIELVTIERIAKAFNKPISMFLEEEQPAGRILSREEEILLDICGQDRELLREMIRCAQKEKLFRNSINERNEKADSGRVAG